MSNLFLHCLNMNVLSKFQTDVAQFWSYFGKEPLSVKLFVYLFSVPKATMSDRSQPIELASTLILTPMRRHKLRFNCRSSNARVR